MVKSFFSLGVNSFPETNGHSSASCRAALCHTDVPYVYTKSTCMQTLLTIQAEKLVLPELQTCAKSVQLH